MSAPKEANSGSATTQQLLQGPRGTRDFYPPLMRQRRWIEDTWRSVSVRHGFEEIDGPRFEHLDLYTIKSGEEIVSELFSFTRHGGETRFALRPEFTPTIARMIAARAHSLPKPTKWFSVGPYFRAERPQRGRLREFLQWNVDIFGDDSPQADAELLACCIDFLRTLGFSHEHVKLRLSNRDIISGFAREAGMRDEQEDHWYRFLDGENKRSNQQNNDFLQEHGLVEVRAKFDSLIQEYLSQSESLSDSSRIRMLHLDFEAIERQNELIALLRDMQLDQWCVPLDLTVVRGLAYYTGMVFEVHETGGRERAIAGGGRYDTLVELFGGPSMPAVGFAMGDVVLSLVLEDHDLMPADEELRELTSQRVHAFVIATKETEHLLLSTVAQMRAAGLHTRHTYKSTRNIGKLLKEASNLGARFAVIIESSETATLKDLDRDGAQETLELSKIPAALLVRVQDDR